MTVGKSLAAEFNESRQENVRNQDELENFFMSFYKNDIEHMLSDMSLNYRYRLIDTATTAVREHHKLSEEVDVQGWITTHLKRFGRKSLNNQGKLLATSIDDQLLAAKTAIRELLYRKYMGDTASFLFRHLRIEKYYNSESEDIIASINIPYDDMIFDSDGQTVYWYMKGTEEDVDIYLTRTEDGRKNPIYKIEID